MVAAIVATSLTLVPSAAAATSGDTATSFDTQMVTLINGARADAGLAPVQSDPGLVSLASWWSREMANGTTGYQLEHNPDAWTMVTEFGASNRTAWAENVAVFSTSASARAVFDAYMASPPHRANMLSSRYHYIGVGTVDSSHGSFNTMEFTDKVDAHGCHPYSDTSAAYLHCENIQWVAQEGIADPAGGTFRATDSITRNTMAAFLYRFGHQKQAAPACDSRPFPDVTTTNPYCGYIAWAKNSNITYGYSDGDYHGGRPVTRGAMAAYFYRTAHDGAALPTCTRAPFRDVPVSNEFCGAITWMKNQGITYGTGDGYYGPTLPVTRGAMASFLHRTSSLL
jgi:uncharacterized protein YkwD